MSNIAGVCFAWPVSLTKPNRLSLLKEQAVASRIGIAEPEFDEYFHQPSVLSKAASGSLVKVVSVSSPLARHSV